MTAAILTLESDWVVALLGVLVTMFSALAWFVRQTVSNVVKELETRMRLDLSEIHEHLRQLTGHITDFNDRVGRIEHQVDETIIPRQEKISRRLDVEE